MKIEDKCSIGELTITECHKIMSTATENISNLSDEGIHLIKAQFTLDHHSTTRTGIIKLSYYAM